MSTTEKVKRIVLIKPVHTDGVERILNGARKGLGCPIGAYGELIHGHTPEQINSYKQLKVDQEFWESLNIILSDQPLRLDLSNERQLCHYRVLKAHPDVANTRAETTIFTKWFIEDEEEEARVMNLKFEDQVDSYANIKKMTSAEKRAFLTLFGKRTKNVSEEVVMKHLKQLADADPKLFNAKFDDKDKATKILLNQLVEYRIIEKDANNSYYHGENLLGLDDRSAVGFLSDPKKQPLKLQLIDALEEKMKI